MNKRTFLKEIAVAGLGLPLSAKAGRLSHSAGRLSEWLLQYEGASAQDLAGDEVYWEGIRGGYKLKPDYINLENGYYNFLPEVILEAYIGHVRDINYQGSYYMRTVQWDNKKAMSAKLAALAGCLPEEVIITRNTTESLDLIIGGYKWKAGDEAIMAAQDYGSMLAMFKLVSDKYGVVSKTVSVPNHPASDEELVALSESAVKPRTRLLMVSHMINITGQILPVRKICEMAHRHGVEVMVDGAHAFGHFQYTIPELDCDYYGSSLHKWLSVPLGSGMLYVKKGLSDHIWPLLAEPDHAQTGINLLNHTGTLPVHTDLAIADAVDYYQKMGPDRKEARLRYIQQYWTRQVRNQPGVIVNTPEDPSRSCAIANVGIKGMKPADLASTLLKKYGIYTVAIDGAGVQGCRITPNVYTTPQDLDVLVKAVKELGSNA
jgi:selenocysteine lyase/cysteine desulfurase